LGGRRFHADGAAFDSSRIFTAKKQGGRETGVACKGVTLTHARDSELQWRKFVITITHACGVVMLS
jgi:hypothetical protein